MLLWGWCFGKKSKRGRRFIPFPLSLPYSLGQLRNVKGDQIIPEEGRKGKAIALPFKIMPEPVTNMKCSTEGIKQTS
jgi:hypothetical protein